MPQDLTGLWIGRYTYKAGGEPVPFEVELVQLGGGLDGHMVEPNTFLPEGGPELIADLIGSEYDGGVSFVKRYRDLPALHHPRYEGRLLASGQRIEGTWRFDAPNWFTGDFTMTRKPRAAARAAQRTVVPTPVGL